MKNLTLVLLFCNYLFINSQERLSSLVSEHTNGNLLNKSEYEYDNVGNLLKEKEYSWDNSNSTWTDVTKTCIYTYNTFNKLVRLEIQIPNNTSTIISFSYEEERLKTYEFDEDRFVINYDNQNIPLEILHYRFNYMNEWELIRKIDLEYNSEGTLASFITKYSSNSIFYEENKVNYTYTSSGQIEEIVLTSFSNLLRKLHYDYSNGNLSEKSAYSYYNNNWDLSYNIRYEYFESETFSDFHPFKDKTGQDFLFHSRIFDLMLGEGKIYWFYKYNLASSNKIKAQYYGSFSKTIYNYSNSTASVENSKNLSFDMFFNESQDILEVKESDFSISTVNIYNILGANLKTEFGKNKISVNELPDGVYVVNIISKDGRVGSKKMIKY